MSLYEWTSGDKAVPMVLTSGRVPQAADEVVLGKTTLTALHAKVGDRVPLTGTKGQPRTRSSARDSSSPGRTTNTPTGAG